MSIVKMYHNLFVHLEINIFSFQFGLLFSFTHSESNSTFTTLNVVSRQDSATSTNTANGSLSFMKVLGSHEGLSHSLHPYSFQNPIFHLIKESVTQLTIPRDISSEHRPSCVCPRYRPGHQAWQISRGVLLSSLQRKAQGLFVHTPGKG